MHRHIPRRPCSGQQFFRLRAGEGARRLQHRCHGSDRHSRNDSQYRVVSSDAESDAWSRCRAAVLGKMERDDGFALREQGP